MKVLASLGTVGTIVTVLIWLLSQTNVVSAETMTVPLNSAGSNVFTAEFAHIPLLINGIAVDISVKANSYLTIWCEFRIGDHYFKFTLNDLSLEYHLEQDRIEVDGKVSKNGIGYFKATVDTDGIIEGIPKVVLSYYSINL